LVEKLASVVDSRCCLACAMIVGWSALLWSQLKARLFFPAVQS